MNRSGAVGANTVLSVHDLNVSFVGSGRTVPAVRGVSFDLSRGEVLGVVGESGSGKSVTALSLMGLLPETAEVSGSVRLDDTEIVGASDRQLQAMRGRDIGIIFQDPMTTLNPVVRIGTQVTEGLVVHNLASRHEAMSRAAGLLREVQIPDPAARARAYPHQFSGGMRQRAVIAMTMATRPKVIIADEPTTALDVTVQAQVLSVLKQVQVDTGSAVILITHDLGVIAEMADRVMVMYAGKVVETGPVEEIFANPQHPYTVGLISSLPRLDADLERLEPIPGQPATPGNLPSGCPFHPRCPLRRGREVCRTEEPPLLVLGPGRATACHFPEEVPDLLPAVPMPTSPVEPV
jgi:oligopeptide/dipeptide ABC transporter ATP-binding protein